MRHVFGVEPVVTKLIHHDLIGGEVVELRETLHEFVYRCEQVRFANLVLVRIVSEVAHGADGHYDIEGGLPGVQIPQECVDIRDDLTY